MVLEYTKAPFWGNKIYTLWILQLLSIVPLTGIFGIDHLYLRSPVTALAKTIVNICTLGFWYFYDLLQVTLDKESVEKFGMSAPFYGPLGVGAGMFLGKGDKVNEDAVVPWRFMIFMLTVCLPFGFDYLAAGDYVGAGVRFFTVVSVLLWPLAFLWTVINMYRAWITPATVFEYGTYRIWPFNWFIDANFGVKGVLAPGKAGQAEPACRQKGIVESLMEPVTTVVGVAATGVKDVILEPVATALDGIAAIPAAVTVPLRAAVKEGLAPTVTAALKVGRLAPAAMAAVPSIATNVSNRLASVSADALAQKIHSQTGGGLEVTDGVLIFTLAMLVFGGIFLTIIRSRENGETDENDTPPDPRTVRRATPTKEH